MDTSERAAPEPGPVPEQLAAGNLEERLSAGEQALLEEGDLNRARVIFTEVAQASLRTGPTEIFARAALGLGGLWVHEHRTAAEAARVTAWQQRAVAALERATPLAARLRMRLAAEEDYHHGTADTVLQLLEEIRAAGDPVATAEAVSLAHHCLLAPEHAALRLRLADEMLALAAVTNRRVDLVLGLTWRTTDLFLLGDRHAERSLRELKVAVSGRPFRAVDFVLGALEVMLTIRAGRLEDAEALAAECAQQGQAAGDADAGGWYVAQIVAIRWFQGRIADLTPMLEEFVHAPTLAGPDDSMLAALAVAAAHGGNRELALSALHRLSGDALAALTPSSTWLVTLVGAAEAAARLGDTTVAGEAYDLLHVHARLPVMASLAIVCFGSPHDTLGAVALAAGDLTKAAEHFEAAVNHNERLGHVPALQLSRAHLEEVRATQTGRGPALTCRPDGDSWLVEVPGYGVRVPDSLGMRYLAALVSHPGQEIAAAELAGAAHVPEVTGEVLDDEAREAYRRRARELQARLEDAQEAGDLAAAERLTAELDWLVTEVERATGLGGRSRRFADGSERARTAVRKAIRRALDRIGEVEPRIAEQLESDLVTGTRCCYRPR